MNFIARNAKYCNCGLLFFIKKTIVMQPLWINHGHHIGGGVTCVKEKH